MDLIQRVLAMSLLVATFIFLSSFPTIARETQSTNDWSAVTNLTRGEKLIVKLRNAKTVEGQLSNASEDALSISVKGVPVRVTRDEVMTVHKVIKKSGTTSALIGAAVGGGAGAAIGAAGGGNDNGFDKIDHAVTAGLAVLGATAGAVGGYFLGRHSKRVLVYKAK